jgi:hypothetical protein
LGIYMMIVRALQRKEVPVRFLGKSRLGFYPLHMSEAQRIRRYFLFPEQPSSALDPCIGDGVAFDVITSGAEVLRYGIELDAYFTAPHSGMDCPSCPSGPHGSTTNSPAMA